jgi:hypothetical protein
MICLRLGDGFAESSGTRTGISLIGSESLTPAWFWLSECACTLQSFSLRPSLLDSQIRSLGAAQDAQF